MKESAPVSVLIVAGLHESSKVINVKKRNHGGGKEKLPKAENARKECGYVEEVFITGSSSIQKKERAKGKDTKKKGKEGINEMHSITLENGNSDTLSEAAEGVRKKKKKKQKGEGGGHGNDNLHPAGADVNCFIKKNDNDKRDNVKALPRCNGVAEVTYSNGNDVETESGDGVIITGENIDQSKYKAIKSFTDSQFPSALLHCCLSFTKPSPIQAHAWPFLLDGRDFVGIAATGSGKTMAFGIPLINHVLKKLAGKSLTKGRNPQCLALSPTRELAQQIFDVVRNAGKPCGVVPLCLYGGTSKGPQIACLDYGVDIIIATPGRLKDMIKMGFCILKEVSFVVLDEADRMLDMGFEPEVRSILCQTSSKRQMAMFSATWPLPVHLLAQEFMNHVPVKVVVGSEDLSANHDVMQIVEVLEDRSRDLRLVALLEKYHKSQRNRVLVFVLYKKEASRVECMLHQLGWKAVSIHGDKSQQARTEALGLFKDASCPLMVATDVASRGLDIPDVEVVINYSFPLTTEDYVHRIGRTGRAGKKGIAHTFFTKDSKGLAGELVNVLREAGQVVPAALLNFGTHVKKKESTMYGAHFREISANAPKAKKITFRDSDDEND